MIVPLFEDSEAPSSSSACLMTDRGLQQQPNKWPSIRTRGMVYIGGYVYWGAQTEMDQEAYVWINRVRLIATTERGHYGESAR